MYFGAGTGNPLPANVASDTFFTWNRESGQVQRALDKPFPAGPSADAKAMASGYVAGYNQYLEDQGGAQGIKDPRCAGRPWIKPITDFDLWSVASMLSMRASSTQLMSAIYAAQPPTAAAGVAGRSSDEGLAEQVNKEFDALGEDRRIDPVLGSNAVGAGKDAATDGASGVMLGNPHFPWEGNERFWEFGIEVPGVVKSVGAGLMGSPVPNIGHNEHVAWSHTVSTAARFTIHRLALNPATGPLTYYVDGVPKQIQKRTIRIKAASPSGTTTLERDIYSSELGPMMINPGSLEWDTAQAWTIADANAGNLRLFDQWLAMNKAGSAQELVDSQLAIQGIPWVNTVGADDQGNAFYSDASVVPFIADTTMQPAGCLVATSPAWVLLGHIGGCLPQTHPQAVEPGILGGGMLPTRVTTGWVQNANDSYWLTNPDSPFTALSPLLGRTNVAQGLRTRIGIDMIGKRIAGTDALPGEKFSLETMKGMWMTHESLGATLTLDALVDLCEAEQGTTPAIAPACPILAAYDGTGKLDSKGGWLFARWFAKASNAADFWAVPYDPANPATTPNTLNVANATAKGKIVTALVEAIDELDARGVALDASHGDVQYTMRGNERIRVPGCNTGCYPVTSVRTGADDYGRVYTGTSFVMFAQMGPGGPRAQALLSYSQSEDVTSPYYADQTKRFTNLDFIDLPFTAAAIEAQKLSRITVPQPKPQTEPQPQPGPQPQPQPQPGPQPQPQPQPQPVGKPKLSLGSARGLSLQLTDLGGRTLRSAKLTLPKGWSIDKKRAKKKSQLKVTSKGAKPKLKTTARTLTITATGGKSLSIKSSKRLIKKKGKSKKKKTVTVKLALTFADGSKQTLSLKVRAS